MISSLRFFAAALLTAFILASPAAAEFRMESIDNDYPNEILEAKAEGKRLILFFHQAGCPYCDKMRARVHPVPKVFDYFSENFVMIESNIKGNLDIVMPDGTEGNERAFAKKIRVRATPVFIFYDLQGKPVLRTTGFIDVDKFYLAGKYVIDEVYKTGKSYFRYLQEQL
ncbi:MAG: thioredoxin family protein [Alphaproteobacteria bacterium]